MSNIHPLSVVHPKAVLGEGCIVQAFAYIEADVVIGSNCWIGNNVSILNGARIGDNCKFYPGAVVSGIPQDLKYKGEPTQLIMGNNVIVRECCTLNKGTINPAVGAFGETKIGDNCLLMAYVHVAHDCIIADRCVLANNVTLAGHIEIGRHATLGGMVAVHQFVRVGDHCMIGGGSLVRKDVPPYVTAAREPLSYAGINSKGLNRRQFSTEVLRHIEDIYRILFQSGRTTRSATEYIEESIPQSAYRDQIIKFVKESKRGLMRGYKPKSGSKSSAEKETPPSSNTPQT